jgi:ABC-type nitrate/sulfonate/bicarbonate transport system substrate-binding protein
MGKRQVRFVGEKPMSLPGIARARRRAACIGIAAFLGIAASDPAHAADHLRVAKPAAIGFGFSLLDVGIAEGIFKRHDLDVESIVLDGAAKQHQAMIAGAIDVTLGAGTDFAFVAKGAPEKGVAALAGPPLNFVAMVRNDGKINTVADLKGKRISASTVGSITYWFANQISVREGWTGADALTIVPLGNFDAMRAALKTGDIDAISATLEGALLLQKEGSGKLLLSYGNLIKPFLTHVAFATDDLMANHPDALRRFLKAWFETVLWMNAHKDEGLRYSMVATGLPSDVSSQAYDAEMPMLFTDGHFDKKAVAVVKQSLVDIGTLPSLPDDSALYTEQFLN